MSDLGRVYAQSVRPRIASRWRSTYTFIVTKLSSPHGTDGRQYPRTGGCGEESFVGAFYSMILCHIQLGGVDPGGQGVPTSVENMVREHGNSTQDATNRYGRHV